ncbi:ASCH domain-containing protein [Desulfosporosinus nitroreducens]|uniref:ASCH domain-containing protein n=1 Tax=Desulfosporosinus nitroreducens TaxID=2018668 RepID=UPI00207CE76A|nr:ASCH domain-containing protein [Desulfosporosinus nitroreducens]MCO1599773.1 ASCH domain-containing protein [Desulfosporosinus nitroreducens]
MKALTVWQPWATLIAERHKKIETRSWSTNIREAVAIHSAKKPFNEVKKLIHPKSITVINNLLYPFSLERLPFGYILAVGNLVDCKLIDEVFLETLDPIELLLGDYTLGRYAWIFEDVKHFKSPILANGSQGFWNWKMRPGIEVVP